MNDQLKAAMDKLELAAEDVICCSDAVTLSHYIARLSEALVEYLEAKHPS